jgi:hypothetical protein
VTQHDPEFLRHVHVVPFDTAVDIEALRFEEDLARYRFRKFQEAREKARSIRLTLLVCIAISSCFWLGVYLWWAH